MPGTNTNRWDRLYEQLSGQAQLKAGLVHLRHAQEARYKNYYRDVLAAYSVAEDENLSALSQRLKGGSFLPRRPLLINVPRPDGLLRPTTLLHLDDLIVYQALAAVLADKFGHLRRPFEHKSVFSNILATGSTRHLFLFEDWRRSHAAFRRAINEWYVRGYEWVAHYDLASFYGTIDHQLLDQLLFSTGYQDFRALLIRCLSTWSSDSHGAHLGHGVPQHLNPSALLSEFYIHHIDEKLTAADVHYVRYVDDFRLFGTSREQVLESVILLTSLCQSAGLVRQTAKYKIFRAESAEDARGKYASLSATDRLHLKVDPDKAAEQLKRALSSTPVDGGLVHRILGAIEPYPLITDIVVDNLAEFPDLTDEFCIYLGQLSSDSRIGMRLYDRCLKVQSPYDYVEGSYWSVLSQFKLSRDARTLLSTEVTARLHSRRTSRPASRLGWYQFLCSNNNCSALSWIAKERFSRVQMLAVPAIRPKCFGTRTFARMLDGLIGRADYEPALVTITQLLADGRSVTALPAPAEDVSGVLSNTLGKPAAIDSVDEILRRRYRIATYEGWKSFLGSDYQHARSVLFLADRSYRDDRNSWVNYTDTFNDIVLRKFVELIRTKLPSATVPRILDQRGKIIDFGVLLNNSGDVGPRQPSLIKAFQSLHKIRSQNPASHAYEKHNAQRTKVVSRKEQLRLRGLLATAYGDLRVALRILV